MFRNVNCGKSEKRPLPKVGTPNDSGGWQLPAHQPPEYVGHHLSGPAFPCQDSVTRLLLSMEPQEEPKPLLRKPRGTEGPWGDRVHRGSQKWELSPFLVVGGEFRIPGQNLV